MNEPRGDANRSDAEMCPSRAVDRPTRVVILTPAGQGAIATVVVDGPLGETFVRRLFWPVTPTALDNAAAGRISLGHWGSPTGEELVVCRRDPQLFEIHCHGGYAAVTAIVDSLVAEGGQACSWADWRRESGDREFEIEARVALARATTERLSLLILDQLTGAWESTFTRILRELEGESAEDRETIRRRAGWELSQVAERYRFGRLWEAPSRVVLFGSPNVGKSSLLNALVGYARAIVHETPGTTRDAVTVTTAFDGWPVELCDTAGDRDTSDEIEAAGVAIARTRRAGADLGVLTLDGSRPLRAEDRSLLDAWPTALVVVNKLDLPRFFSSDELPGAENVRVSALTGEGVETLVKILGRRLFSKPPTPGDAVPLTRRQYDLVGAAREALDRDDFPKELKRLRDCLA